MNTIGISLSIAPNMIWVFLFPSLVLLLRLPPQVIPLPVQSSAYLPSISPPLTSNLPASTPYTLHPNKIALICDFICIIAKNIVPLHPKGYKMYILDQLAGVLVEDENGFTFAYDTLTSP